ncbi:MobF family relaxase [Corynebacterium sp. H128]|uniref:MobF family relaxase n=1 Tax=Corynebacterium sp. H128 TaxID=3133427 RepID=UPI00309B79A2
MMTLHRLYAGTGYTYLTDSVATQDRPRVPGQDWAAYQNQTGTPPGQWFGKGAKVLGMSGEVTEEHMLALWGEGIRPDADERIAAEIKSGKTARQALGSVCLGRRFLDSSSDGNPLLKRINSRIFTMRYTSGKPLTNEQIRTIKLEVGRKSWPKLFPDNPDPTDRQIMRYIGKLEKSQGKPVAGFDMVFTPVKSVTALWGIADESWQKKIESAHREAVSETLEWIEEQVSFSRKGYNGTIQVRAEGLAIARFDHYDNRAGDPNLHTHCAVSNKVYCPDDDKWRALDGRAIFQINVSGSQLYNRTIKTKLERLGLSFREDSRGAGKSSVYELAAVPDSILREFSRRNEIEARMNQLIDAYRDKHKREPSVKVQIKLAEQANLETRGDKQAPQSLTDMRSQWRDRALETLGSEHVLSQILTSATNVSERAEVPFHAESARLETLETLQRRRSAFNANQLYNAATEAVMRYTFDSVGAQNAAIEQTVEAVKASACVAIDTGEGLNVAHLPAHAQEALFYQSRSTVYTTKETLYREQKLLDAAHTLTPFTLTNAAINAAIEDVEQAEGFTMNDGQRESARFLLATGTQLSAVVGPAGAGKTTAMKAVSLAWQNAGHNVVALGPSAKAAQVLGNDLGIEGKTIAHILECDKHGVDTGIGVGTLIIVDEAGMASTQDLFRLNEIAQRSGAVVRLIGDPAQLSAVDTGGMLATITRDLDAPTMDTVVRFKTEGEAEATLKIREGAADSIDFYQANDRLHSGTAEGLQADILAAWLADTEQGLTSLMMGTTRRDVFALNQSAQRARIERGELSEQSPSVTASDDSRLLVGDRIVTRKNSADARMIGGADHGRRIFNGDLWTVEQVNEDGTVRARHLDTGGRAELSAEYVSRHVELGYAATVHRAQGMTVDTGHLLANSNTSRELAYVGLTRGKKNNHAWIVTEQRIDPEAEHDQDTTATIEDAWAQMMARTTDNVSAIDSIMAEPDGADALMGQYQHVHDMLVYQYTSGLLHEIAPHVAEEILGNEAMRYRVENAVRHRLAGHDCSYSDLQEHNWRNAWSWIAAFEDSTTPVQQQAIATLPPATGGVDAELLDWARTARVELLDQRATAQVRGAQLGHALTPQRAQTLADETLADNAAVLVARRDALTLAQGVWRSAAEDMRMGRGHERLERSHAGLLATDAAISTVLKRRKSALTATGTQHERLMAEVRHLEQGLPPATQWAQIRVDAAKVREDIGELAAVEHTAQRGFTAKLTATNAELEQIERALSVIAKEQERRQDNPGPDADMVAQIGAGDARFAVAVATTTPEDAERALVKAKNGISRPEDVVRALLDGDNPAEAVATIQRRLADQLSHVETVAVDAARPVATNDDPDAALLAERRKLMAELGELEKFSVDATAGESDLRRKIRDAMKREAELDQAIVTAENRVVATQRVYAGLPEVPESATKMPTGMFATKKAKEQAHSNRIAWQRKQQARRDLTVATNAVATLRDERARLTEGLPSRDKWKSVLAAEQTSTTSARRIQIRARIDAIDTKIGLRHHQAKQPIHRAHPHQQAVHKVDKEMEI